jgi:P-type E1-E2 ATPase
VSCGMCGIPVQRGVPATIGQLSKAGIKFWMCTGDKFTTALTIARTCNLKLPQNQLVIVAGSTAVEVR